jgi:leucyl-tRNA synthetase
MELVNAIHAGRAAGADESVVRCAIGRLVQVLAPIAPHICEELWERMGSSESILTSSFPTWDEAALKVDALEIPVSVNGKFRAKVMLAVDAPEAVALAAAKGLAAVEKQIEGKQVRKVIYQAGKMLNIVVG